MDGKLLDPEEVIRLRIAIRERRRTRLPAEVGSAREGTRAPSTPESVANSTDAGTQAGAAPSTSAPSTADEIYDLSKLTLKQLRERLSSRGIAFPTNASKADLIHLLQTAGD